MAMMMMMMVVYVEIVARVYVYWHCKQLIRGSQAWHLILQ